MSHLPVVRSNSSVCLVPARDLERGIARVPTLSRVTSVPNLSNWHVDSSYAPSTLFPYRHKGTRYFDEQAYDQAFYHAPLFWADRRYNGRRFMHTDPIPDSLGLDYPNFWSRYKWYKDYLEPQHWRRYRDPNYDRPLWNSWKPYILDGKNIKDSIDLYRHGLVSFAYLDKQWITPWALGRKEKDWKDIYPAAGKYGSRRYQYSWA